MTPEEIADRFCQIAGCFGFSDGLPQSHNSQACPLRNAIRTCVEQETASLRKALYGLMLYHLEVKTGWTETPEVAAARKALGMPKEPIEGKGPCGYSMPELVEALDGLTTVAEVLVKEGAVRGPLALQGWISKAKNALSAKTKLEELQKDNKP